MVILIFSYNTILADAEYENIIINDVEGAYYNYAPTVIREGKTLHVFFCSNVTQKKVVDHILYKKCTITSQGIIEDEPVVVLSPGDGWDSANVCDPSVVKGHFTYAGYEYSYLMAYLGCDRTDCQDNKIGFAVSNDYIHWTKIDNYIITLDSFDKKSKIFQWGVGQPSILWKNGRLYVFYTSGSVDGTCEKLRIYDNGNFDEPTILNELTINNMPGDIISNADFAWRGNKLYMICDKHPFSEGTLNIVADESDVYMTTIKEPSELAKCKWIKLDSINQDDTGYLKNHNTCFIRHSSGRYLKGYVISVANEKKKFIDSLWTYRLLIYF